MYSVPIQFFPPSQFVTDEVHRLRNGVHACSLTKVKPTLYYCVFIFLLRGTGFYLFYVGAVASPTAIKAPGKSCHVHVKGEATPVAIKTEAILSHKSAVQISVCTCSKFTTAAKRTGTHLHIPLKPHSTHLI